ncbi:unnamed protein product [Paramecium sonneborni]|uniref:Uncharacterized protein n=1 Tax=Paramecium sonneborni TaxID=65129 RepID=A0A8S1QAQ6_9CILI|nr:unnamed protein product [Paramecium sonneborni]
MKNDFSTSLSKDKDDQLIKEFKQRGKIKFHISYQGVIQKLETMNEQHS